MKAIEEKQWFFGTFEKCLCGVWESPGLERSNPIGIIKKKKQGTCSKPAGFVEKEKIALHN